MGKGGDALHIPTEGRSVSSNPDWEQGYGFQFWMSRHGYRGDGAYGQFCVVLPEKDVVIAMTAQTVEMQAVLSAVWDKLLPAFVEEQLPDSGADSKLEDRRNASPSRPSASRPRRWPLESHGLTPRSRLTAGPANSNALCCP